MVLDIYVFYFFVMWLSLSTYFIFLFFGNLVTECERVFIKKVGYLLWWACALEVI